MYATDSTRALQYILHTSVNLATISNITDININMNTTTHD